MKVFIKVRNGLGNQMFQYALGCLIKKKYPAATIIYEQSSLPNKIANRITQNINSVFVENFRIASDKEIRLYCGNIIYNNRFKNSTSKNVGIRIYKYISERIHKISLAKLIKEPLPFWNVPIEFAEYIINLPLKEHGIYNFIGYWEDVRYLQIIKNELPFFFTFNCSSDLNERYKDIIKKENTVMIHIRRGDYLTENNSGNPYEYYNICRSDYYRSAINIIEKKVENPFYIFFSDDINYVHEKYNDISNKVIVSENKDYEDLYLMTQCKNFILANSTFSFWGAYLAKNTKIVIAPEVHYLHIDKKEITIKKYFYVSGWIYIDNIKEFNINNNYI